MSVWGIHLLRKIAAGPSGLASGTLGFINHLRRLQGLPQFSSEDEAYTSGYINSKQYYDALDAYNAARGLPPVQRQNIDNPQPATEGAATAAERSNRANNPDTLNTAAERPRIQIPGLGPGSRVGLNGEKLADPEIYAQTVPRSSTTSTAATTDLMRQYGNFARTRAKQSLLFLPDARVAEAMDIYRQNQPQSVFNEPAQQKQPLLPPRKDTLQPGAVFRDMAANQPATPISVPLPMPPLMAQRTSAQTITGKAVNFQPGMDVYGTKSGGIIQVEAGTTDPPIPGATLISKATDRPTTPQANKPDDTPNNTAATPVNNAAASQPPSNPSAVTPQQRYQNALKYYERTGNKLEANRLRNALNSQDKAYSQAYLSKVPDYSDRLDPKKVGKPGAGGLPVPDPEADRAYNNLNRRYNQEMSRRALEQKHGKYDDTARMRAYARLSSHSGETTRAGVRRPSASMEALGYKPVDRNDPYLGYTPTPIEKTPKPLGKSEQHANAVKQLNEESTEREDRTKDAASWEFKSDRPVGEERRMNAEFDAIGKPTPPAPAPKTPNDVSNIHNGAAQVAQTNKNGAPKAQY